MIGIVEQIFAMNEFFIPDLSWYSPINRVHIFNTVELIPFWGILAY